MACPASGPAYDRARHSVPLQITQLMRTYFAKFIALLLFAACLLAARPARAVYPAPWPDAGSADVNTGWTAYTALGTPISDRPSSTDGSTGGTTPTQSADFISGGLPSLYV